MTRILCAALLFLFLAACTTTPTHRPVDVRYYKGAYVVHPCRSTTCNGAKIEHCQSQQACEDYAQALYGHYHLRQRSACYDELCDQSTYSIVVERAE